MTEQAPTTPETQGTPAPSPEAAPSSAPAPSLAPEASGAAPAAAEAPASAAPTGDQTKPSEAPAPEVSRDPTLLETHDAEAKAAEKKEDEKPSEPDKKAEDKAPDAKPEAKPEDKKPDEKPAEAKPDEKPAEPAPLEFELPEPLKATKPDDAMLAEFKTILTEGGEPKAVGEKLLNLYAKGMQAYHEHMRQEQVRAFNEVCDQWRTAAKADPQIGGAGHQTAMKAIARARDLLVSRAKPGTPEYQSDMDAFNQFLRATGAGDHPVFLRILHNASRYFDEPAPPRVPGNPPKDNGRAGNRASVLYDNPRSHVNRQ